MTEYKIPALTLVSLQRYKDYHVPTGGFLRSVLENNLVESFFFADEENRLSLSEIVRWVYYEMPAIAHGSREKVDSWLYQGRPNGDRS